MPGGIPTGGADGGSTVSLISLASKAAFGEVTIREDSEEGDDDEVARLDGGVLWSLSLLTVPSAKANCLVDLRRCSKLSASSSGFD